MKKIWLSSMVFLSLSAFAQNSKRIPAPIVAVQTWTFHVWSFLETIDKADSLGFHYLEVYPGQIVGGGIPGKFSYNLDADARAKLLDYLKYKKMKVIALGVVDKNYYTRDNLEKFFIFCRDMKIPFMTAEPETADLDLFNRLAGKYGIKVALHAHPRPSSHYPVPDSIVVAMKGRANIGAWPDIAHWARNGADIVDGLKKVKGKLWGMHFNDIQEFNNTAARDTLLGLGVCKLPEVIDELQRLHFKGVITLEYEIHEQDNMADMRLNKLYSDIHFKKLFAD